MQKLLLTILLSVAIGIVYSQSTDSAIAIKKYYTQRVSTPINLDGTPDEAAWSTVDFGGNFTQNQPHNGAAPSFPTQFKILYDDRFIYIAFWNHDAGTDSVIKRMGRRDDFPGDFVEVNIDSYHDKRT